MHKQGFLLFLLFGLVLLASCKGGEIDISKLSEEDVNKVIICKNPYIRYAAGCCLDKNNNSICDDDETINQDDDVKVIPTIPTTTTTSLPTGLPGEVVIINAKELVDDDPSLGNNNAEVTIVEFSDFQCPFCGRFREQTFDSIKKDYIDTGKVRFVYRDFPLSFHENAENSAIASECADEQGKFWEYHDKLFKNQQALDVANLKKYAGELKLDSGKFDKCLDDGKYKDEVNKDLADGSRVGISGTPSFIIGGRQLSGAQPYASFKATIDAELAKN